MDWACSRHGRLDEFIYFSPEVLREDLEDLGIDGRIIIK